MLTIDRILGLTRTLHLLTVVGFTLAAACSGGSSDDPAPPELGPELVLNGSFEDGNSQPIGWVLTVHEPGQIAHWSTEAAGGRFVRMSAPMAEGAGWPEAAMTTTFDASAGSKYRVAISTKSDSFGLLLPIIWFSDARGQEIEGKNPGTWDVSSADWSGMDFTVTAPEETVFASVLFRLALNETMTEETNLSVSVTNVSVREVLD